MPIGYDPYRETLAYIPDECDQCGEPMYFTGCDAPECTGFCCMDCAVGCDLELMGDDGVCARAIAEEPDDVRLARINAGRVAFGLLPIKGA